MMPHEEPTYEQMATALAAYVYLRCTLHNGHLGFSHCGENGFDVAPHILDRLNVMDCNSQYAEFRTNYKPDQQLAIWRNANEPTRDEFAIAFVTAVRWNWPREWANGRQVFKAALDVSSKPSNNPISLIANCLQQMGLGDGAEQGFLMLNERGEAVPEYWAYWTPENRRRYLLKQEPSRRQRAELKLQGVIDPGRTRYL